MRVLFVLSYHRTASYILPAIERLAETEEVFVFRYRMMASTYSWSNDTLDHLPATRRRLERAGVTDLGEPRRPHDVNRDTYSAEFREAIKGLDIDLAVFDESMGKVNWGGIVFFYRILRERGVPCIACQEGSTEDDENGLKRVAWNLGRCYDFCFCFGGFDEERLLRENPNLDGRIFAVGIPANDALAVHLDRSSSNEGHVLLVPSYTGTPSGPPAWFEPLTDKIIEATGIFEFADRHGLRIVIKEKAKQSSKDCAFSHLRGPNVTVTFDEHGLDELVASSKYVLGAPSTLLFKAVQLRIPTAVLGEPYMGRRGVFQEFSGLTDSSRDEVFATLERQERNGGCEAGFIERAVAGGSTFTSTDRFLDSINRVLDSGSNYAGPLFVDRFPLRERLFKTFPRAFKKIDYPLSRALMWGGKTRRYVSQKWNQRRHRRP